MTRMHRRGHHQQAGSERASKWTGCTWPLDNHPRSECNAHTAGAPRNVKGTTPMRYWTHNPEKGEKRKKKGKKKNTGMGPPRAGGTPQGPRNSTPRFSNLGSRKPPYQRPLRAPERLSGPGVAVQGPRRGVSVFNGAGNKVGHSEAFKTPRFPGCL